MQTASIRYSEFYDVPRRFVVVHNGISFLFDCPFDESLDGYPVTYSVYRLSAGADQMIEESGWDSVEASIEEELGTVPVSSVHFDFTRRKEIKTQILDELTQPTLAGNRAR